MTELPQWFVWFTIAQAVVMAVVAVLLAALRLGASGSRALRLPEENRHALEALRADVASLRVRMDEAGQQTSDTADLCQALVPRMDRTEARASAHSDRMRQIGDDLASLPFRLQQDFVTRREYSIAQEEARERARSVEQSLRELAIMRREPQ